MYLSTDKGFSLPDKEIDEKRWPDYLMLNLLLQACITTVTPVHRSHETYAVQDLPL
jgi:hypothetical protein